MTQVFDATGTVVDNGVPTAPAVPTTTPVVTITTTTKPTTQLSTLSQIEKLVVWLCGLFAAAAGALTAAKGVLPVPVSTFLIALLPVVIAVERYITGNAGSS